MSLTPGQPELAAGISTAGVVANEPARSAPLALAVDAAPVTLRAAADAYVRDGTYAGQNFGAGTELQLKKNAAGSNREVYLKFNLAGVSSVGTGKLRLFGRIDSATERPTVAVYPAADTNWGEGAINWNVRPVAGTPALATATIATATPKWYEWDVTQYLAAQKAAGATAVTLVVRSLTTTTPHMIFASDESAANRPELLVAPAGQEPPPPPAEPTIVASPAPLAVTEGSSAQLAVRLSHAPASNVTVRIARDQPSDPDLSASLGWLTFTPANWNVPQAVTVRALPDADTTAGTATFILSGYGNGIAVVANEVDTGPNTTAHPPATLAAAADTYVRDGAYAGQNYGGATELHVQNLADSTRISYLRFDISALAGAASAKLRVFGRLGAGAAAGSKVTIDVSAGADPWAENTLSWNNRVYGNGTGQRFDVTGTTGRWYEVDLTATIHNLRELGVATVTLILRDVSFRGPTAVFNSDEASTSRPQLVVEQAPALQDLISFPFFGTDLHEGGAAEPVGVKLKARPQEPVVLTFAPKAGSDPDLTTSVQTMTFMPEDWDVPQTLTLAAAQDADSVNGRADIVISAPGVKPVSFYLNEIDDDPMAQPITLNAVADAHVRDGTYAAQNFGTATQLQLKRAAAGWNRESYLRFDLSQVTGVSSAKLRLFGNLDNTAAASVGFGVHASTHTSWEESQINWHTRPATSGTGPLATGVVTGTTGKWYEVDLTSYLQQQKSVGASAVTLVLRAPAASNATVLFDSDEAANRPQLIVAG